jgi:glycine cleavage system transcriptional repressor
MAIEAQKMKKHLVISALGEDKPGIVDGLSRAIMECGCNIVDSRMTVLGGEFAVILMVTGNWNAIAKLENALPGLGKRLGLMITSKRTEQRRHQGNLLPYAVDVVAMDHPGIVHNLANFFSSRNINIQDMVTTSYSAAHTGTPMFSVPMTVDIPSEMHIAALREEFMDFCDELNLDAVIEPVKG